MSAYICTRHPNAAAFLERAQNWLLEREAESSLLLGIASEFRASQRDDGYFASVEHDGEIVGAAFRTIPQKMSVTRMPLGAAEALIRNLLEHFDDAPTVMGAEAAATAVAAGIARARGKRVVPGARLRIYQLHDVIPPERLPAGYCRAAESGDKELLVGWLEKFGHETGHGSDDWQRFADSQIDAGRIFVWDDDGVKTMAVWSGLTPHGVRIGHVYTPAEFRGRGYASGCVAEASRRALAGRYRFCMLYTDLSNPVSNGIYQRIGYQPVTDVLDCHIA